MTDRVDAAVQRVQPTRLDPATYRGPTKSQLSQLGERDHTVPPGGERRDRPPHARWVRSVALRDTKLTHPAMVAVGVSHGCVEGQGAVKTSAPKLPGSGEPA
jgi:hypothetical protein